MIDIGDTGIFAPFLSDCLMRIIEARNKGDII